MKFEWGERKNLSNIRKHGIDFNDVTDMFFNNMLTYIDTKGDYFEERWIGIGWMKSLLGLVVYVERHEDKIRIISARKATKHEIKNYEKHIKN